MRIEIDDLTHPQVLALLNEHLTNMFELSPPEQVFALDVTKLRAPDITFWAVWTVMLCWVVVRSKNFPPLRVK